MPQPIELMTLFWTTAGVSGDLNAFSRFDFRERLEAAARAGFKGIGIWHTDLAHTLQKYTLPEMKAILDDNGVICYELEFLTDWFVEGEKRRESDRWRHLLLEASAALRAHHVKIGDFNNTSCPTGKVVEAFAGLCKEAEDYGAVIGFEFMASSMIHDLPGALSLVEAAGAKNGGLVLDIVHVVNLGISHAAIRQIPCRHLVSVELDDGYPPADPRHDTTGGRLYCGEGGYDLKGFIESVRQTGYRGPWAVEVFSQAVAELPLDEANRRAFETTLAQL